MWILRRFVELGISTKDLIMTYTARIRVLVEPNVALWSFSINDSLVKAIEKVQKIACFIILGKHSTQSYSRNLSILKLETLERRRDILCKKFAAKTFKHPAHKQMFTLTKGTNTRSGRKVVIPQAKHARYERSSIPSLAKIINEMK